MRLGVIIRRLQRAPWPLGGWGGALAGELARLGHDVTILALLGDPEACPSGVKLVQKGFHDETHLATEPDLLAWRRWTRRTRRRMGFDLTITLDHFVPADVAVPERGGAVESLSPLAPPTWRAALAWAAPLDPLRIGRAGLSESLLIATQTESARDRMERLAPREDAHVVALGGASAWATMRHSDRNALAARTRAAFGVDPEAWVGALVTREIGHEQRAALEGFREAARRTGAPSVALVASRSALRAWKRIPAPSETFRGVCVGGTRRLDALFAAADFALTPGAPSAWVDPALVDALRQGRPVVSARGQAGLELLEVGASGRRPALLARRDDPDSWGEAVARLLAPGALRPLAEEASRRAQELSIARFARALERAMRMLRGERVKNAPQPRVRVAAAS